MADESVERDNLDPLQLFPEKIRDAVQGLAYLGQLSEEVHFCGHSFGLRTLRASDKFAVSIALQPFRNTVYEVEIFQAAHVAMALTSVDGDEDFCPPIGPNVEEFAKARLNYVLNGPDGKGGWYEPTIHFLWNRLAILEGIANEAIAELDRLSTRSQPSNSSPWLGSSTEPGNSPAPTVLASQPSTSSK